MRPSKKVAIVTGGGGGIGSTVAKLLSAEKTRVVVADVRGDAAQRIAKDIITFGGEAIGEKLDVRSYAEIETLVERAVNHFGQVNIAVNCAGILSIDSFEKITEDQWDNIMDVNAKGTFLFCKAIANQMIRQGTGGKIVNVSSVAGKIGVPLYTHYCASKFAVIGITKSLALELAKHKINVNAVCPGDVETDMLDYEFRTHAQMRKVSPNDI
ncbi:MAG: SDR family NAD(P)-dependent oxidoreductase [Candidatus Bathyarchaeia archaeon]|jgi:meso-butanediol dehydrogenase/(S,S)-butanediol dehydrogenase/diacetyl reductase